MIDRPSLLGAIGQTVTLLVTGRLGMPAGGSPTTSTTWVTANKAFYWPVRVVETFTPALIFWGNGAAASGNLDAGIYTDTGVKLFSTGSTAQDGAKLSTLQSAAVSGVVLGPGRYYLALAFDNTTATMLRGSAAAALQRTVGILQEASAFPLPASATFASLVTSFPFMPLFGLSRKSVV